MLAEGPSDHSISISDADASDHDAPPVPVADGEMTGVEDPDAPPVPVADGELAGIDEFLALVDTAAPHDDAEILALQDWLHEETNLDDFLQEVDEAVGLRRIAPAKPIAPPSPATEDHPIASLSLDDLEKSYRHHRPLVASSPDAQAEGSHREPCDTTTNPSGDARCAMRPSPPD